MYVALKKILKNKVASAATIAGVVIALIVASVLIGLGVYMNSQIYSTMPTPNDTTAQEIIQQTQTTTYNVYKLLPLALIALGIGAVLTAIFWAFRSFGGISFGGL